MSAVAPARFFARGWAAFEPDPATAAWAAAAAPLAQAMVDALEGEWRCGGTWFPGVNALPNDASGGAPALGLPPLSGLAVDFARDALSLTDVTWDRAQISACLPGYPRPGAEETEAAARFRRDRDAAHVDGLERVMPGRRRRPSEFHAFILGIPLCGCGQGRSPMVVWEGSHEIFRTAFQAALDGVPPERWRDVDVTEAYVAARKRAFETCARVEVSAADGAAYLVHRLSLHGVAPWAADGDDTQPRVVAYFRPEFPTTPDRGVGAAAEAWLSTP